MKSPRRAMVTLVTIDSKGNYEKTPMFKAKDQGIILKPLLSEQISQTELLIYGEKGKVYKFGRVKFH